MHCVVIIIIIKNNFIKDMAINHNLRIQRNYVYIYKR